MGGVSGAAVRPSMAPELAALLAAAFALRLAVFFIFPNIIYPDAIFQILEPAHRLAFGSGLITWEWLVGIRSWLLPGLAAALMWLGHLLGDSPVLVNLPVEIFLALTSCATVACAYGWGRDASGRLGGFIAGAVCAVWIDLVYMSNQALAEVIAGHCLIVGLYLGYRGPDQLVSQRRLLWAGLLLGLTFILRFHLAPALAVAALGICGTRRGVAPWKPFLLGAILPVLALAVLDWVTWGMPLQSIWLNFWINVVVGVSKAAGSSPFATLMVMPVQVWGAAGFLVFMIAVGFGARPLPLLLFIALTIFVSHSLFSHKEYRFIYPALPLLVVLAGVGTGRVLQGLVTARPSLARVRGPLAAGMCLAWAGLSLSIAMSDVFSVPWTRSRAQLSAFELVSRDPQVCGVAIYNMYQTMNPGRTWLRPQVGLFESNAARLPAEGAGYNAIITRPGVPIPDPAYRRLACFRGDVDASGKAFNNVCVWRRPDGCVAGASPEPEPIWTDFTAAKRYVRHDKHAR